MIHTDQSIIIKGKKSHHRAVIEVWAFSLYKADILVH